MQCCIKSALRYAFSDLHYPLAPQTETLWRTSRHPLMEYSRNINIHFKCLKKFYFLPFPLSARGTNFLAQTCGFLRVPQKHTILEKFSKWQSIPVNVISYIYMHLNNQFIVIDGPVELKSLHLNTSTDLTELDLNEIFIGLKGVVQT